MISKLQNLRQVNWVSKHVIYFHLTCHMSAVALVQSYSQLFGDVEMYVLYENASIILNFSDILESLTQWYGKHRGKTLENYIRDWSSYSIWKRLLN
jgi:hypothetical protein